MLLPSELEAGEAFLKGGLDLRDSPISRWGLADRWLVAGGYDWKVSPITYLGFEAQSGYQSFAIGGKISAKVVPLNGFLNVRVKPEAPTWQPYGGGGIGLLSQLDWEKVPFFPEVVDVFEFRRDLGAHFFGGLQIGKGFIEYMAQRAIGETSLVGTSDRWSHLLLGGIAW